MSRLRAIIFDCDGVIADTEPVHCDAFARTLAEHNISMSREEYYADCLGFDDEGLFEHIFRRDGNPLSRAEMDTLLTRKRELYMTLIEADRVQLPGVVDFVRDASQRWPLAICSAAIRPEVDHITEALGIASCFAVIVTAENVAATKPHPEGYLQALRLLNETGRFDPPLRADECLVIEDSVPGIRAGQAAGMTVLAVASSHPADQLTAANAVTPTLADIDPTACWYRLQSSGRSDGGSA